MMKMRRTIIVMLTVVFTLFMLPKANAALYGGIDFPQGAVSFADSVVSYMPGPGVVPPYNDPARALGIPDSHAMGLGLGGTLILKFDDNSLTTSGDGAKDLWIFEYGKLQGGHDEPTYVSLSTDGQNWKSVGDVPGGTSGIDIDSFIGSGITLGERYSYVKLIDKNNHISTDGADIDAVGAYSSAAKANNLTTTVAPEPISSVLFVIGGALLGGRYYSRRRK